MNRQELNPKTRLILEFLESYIQDNSFPPTVRDIMLALDISSTSVVDYNLNLLVSAGFISRKPDTSRGIRLLGTPDSVTLTFTGEDAKTMRQYLDEGYSQGAIAKYALWRMMQPEGGRYAVENWAH